MKNYLIYCRLSNPFRRVKIGSFCFIPSKYVLMCMAEEYASCFVCNVVSIEVCCNRKVVLSIDF